MSRQKSVIISCVPTVGSCHTPTMSGHLPITPSQIATASTAAHAGVGTSVFALDADTSIRQGMVTHG